MRKSMKNPRFACHPWENRALRFLVGYQFIGAVIFATLRKPGSFKRVPDTKAPPFFGEFLLPRSPEGTTSE